VVVGVPDREDVVADRPMTAKDDVDHLLPVDEVPHRLTNPVVLERRGVNAQCEWRDRAGVRYDDFRAASCDLTNGGEGEERDDVDLTSQERVDLCRLGGEVVDHDRIDVGPTGLPVVLVADEFALNAGFERLCLEGASSDWLLRVVADRDDAEVVVEAGD